MVRLYVLLKLKSAGSAGLEQQLYFLRRFDSPLPVVARLHGSELRYAGAQPGGQRVCGELVSNGRVGHRRQDQGNTHAH